jgi:rhomboid protease GluP
MPTIRKAIASILIVAVLCAVFALELTHAAPENNAELLRLGALPDNGAIHGEYWRLATFGFLHWNTLHLALNVACLMYAGPIVERRIASWKALLLFLAASIFSGLAIVLKHHFFPSAGVTVGASGGAFAFLGAAVVLIRRVPPEKIGAAKWLSGVLAVALAISLIRDVSMVGHLAGLLIGAPFGYLVRTRSAAQVS